MRRRYAVTAVVLDFDDTLATSGMRGYFSHIASYGYDEALITRIYQDVRMGIGNCPRNLLTRLSEEIEIPDLEQKIAETERAHMRASVPYPDSKPNVLKWRRRGIPVHILSHGEQTFQPKKIKSAGIPCDGMHIIDATGSKGAVITYLLDRYGAPIAHVNDKASEHDAIADAIGENGIYEVWMQRSQVDSLHGKEGKRSYIDIHTLDDIDFQLR